MGELEEAGDSKTVVMSRGSRGVALVFAVWLTFVSLNSFTGGALNIRGPRSGNPSFVLGLVLGGIAVYCWNRAITGREKRLDKMGRVFRNTMVVVIVLLAFYLSGQGY